MHRDVAFAAVDRLFEGLLPGDRAAIAFLGGEPLINRELIADVTDYACAKAQRAGAAVGFSITTNGTLVKRHVLAQSACHSCWARFLCGGGCHHEVVERGRPACDYIRGWLSYCLETYVWVMESHPHFLKSC
jgi:sulfatase maturation enzyme AslB (radical SAM superfamily)